MPLTWKSLSTTERRTKTGQTKKLNEKSASLSSVSSSSPFWVEDKDQTFIIAAQISVIFFFLCGA